MEVKQTNVIKICLVGYEKTAKLILIKLFVEVVYGKRRNTFSYDVDDVFDESLNAYTENLFFSLIMCCKFQANSFLLISLTSTL